jgi:hypothetical protein
MAEMNIRSGPLRVVLTDDGGKTVADLRYPKVKWSELVVRSEDCDLEIDRVGPRRVVITRKPEAAEPGEDSAPDPLDAARQLGESLDILVKDFARGVKDLLGL